MNEAQVVVEAGKFSGRRLFMGRSDLATEFCPLILNSFKMSKHEIYHLIKRGKLYQTIK